MTELWKDVVGFEDRYQISNLGRVYSKITNKILVPVLSQNDFLGYYRVTFRFPDGKPHSKAIHRMVAEAFIPNPNKLPCVNHIDGNKLNNVVDNLEWCTKSYNAKHAYENNLNGYRDKYFKKCLLATNRKVLVILEDPMCNKFYFKSTKDAAEFLNFKTSHYISGCERRGNKLRGIFKVYTFSNRELISIANGEKLPDILLLTPWKDFILKEDEIICNDYSSEGK